MDPELGKWICNQRERHRGLLSKKRVQRLKDLGFQFDGHNDRWECRYCKHSEFKEEHGHCNVPDSWPENLKLARWIMTQGAICTGKVTVKGSDSETGSHRFHLVPSGTCLE